MVGIADGIEVRPSMIEIGLVEAENGGLKFLLLRDPARGNNYRMILRFLSVCYLSAVVIISYYAIAIAIESYQNPVFSLAVSRVPTWIGAYFGTIFAVVGAFLIAAWKHDKEKKEEVKNLAHVLAHEATAYMSKASIFIELSITRIIDKDFIIDRTTAENLISTHILYLKTDIPTEYRGKIRIFDDDTLDRTIKYLQFMKSVNNYFYSFQKKEIEFIMNNTDEYIKTIKTIITSHNALINQLSKIHPPIIYLNKRSNISENLKKLVEIEY